MRALSDGEYSIFIIDADPDANDVVRVEMTITAGEHKGEVIAVRASHLARDPIDLIGMPGTLVVHDGTPHLVIDD